MLKFIYNYLRSMRLYYGFVTATTVLAGLYQWHRFGSGTDSALHPAGWTRRDAALLAMGFFAWGFNQIFSDWCDRKEDAINAPPDGDGRAQAASGVCGFRRGACRNRGRGLLDVAVDARVPCARRGAEHRIFAFEARSGAELPCLRLRRFVLRAFRDCRCGEAQSDTGRVRICRGVDRARPFSHVPTATTRT